MNSSGPDLGRSRASEPWRARIAKRLRWPGRDRIDLWGLLLATAISALGGAVFSALALPLPWLLGATFLTTIAAVSGARVAIPFRFRGFMFVVLGVMLGSSFTRDVLEHAGRWLISLTGILLYVATVAAILFVFLRKVAGYDRVTAYFAATPGGFAEMTAIGTAMGGDERKIALTQAMRIVLIVFIIAFGFRLFQGYVRQAGGGQYVPLAAVPIADFALLAGCGVVGAVLGRLLRLPAGFLLGPLFVSAAVHLVGLTASRPPSILVAIAQVIIGGAIGCRFVGTPPGQILRALVIALGCAAVMLTATVGFGFALSPLTGMSAPALILAFAPGGLAEMTLIALALGIDTAFVTTHSIARVLFIVVLAPLVFRLSVRRSPPKAPKQ